MAEIIGADDDEEEEDEDENEEDEEDEEEDQVSPKQQASYMSLAYVFGACTVSWSLGRRLLAKCLRCCAAMTY